jgi:hypothetical protein
MVSDIQAVEERLARLERENRRFKLAALLVLVALGAVFVMGVSLGERVVNADAYTLTGPRGEPRAMLGLAPDEPMLVMYDPQGNARVWLGVVDNVPGIVLLNEKGEAVWKAPPSPAATGPSGN